MSTVYFSDMSYEKYEPEHTLPMKLHRQLIASGLGDKVKGKNVVIKVHVGSNLGYTTIPPVFMRIVASFIKENGGNCFFVDHYVAQRQPQHRGYTEESLGAPVLEASGYLGKYLYYLDVDYKTFKHVDVAGLIHDADFLVNLSHFKGHGSCAYGGAVKNIAMGCVSDRTRREIHSLEGGIDWDKDSCIYCNACIESCNHFANKFDDDDNYTVDAHACTLCQHCYKVCPTGAISLTGKSFRDFQEGLAICTKSILDLFEPGNVFNINLLIAITAMCDCWGITTPSLVPDIGVMSSWDIASIDMASLDQVKMDNLIEVGVPSEIELGTSGHLFERLHGKDPYTQIEFLEKHNMGSADYTFEMIK